MDQEAIFVQARHDIFAKSSVQSKLLLEPGLLSPRSRTSSTASRSSAPHVSPSAVTGAMAGAGLAGSGAINSDNKTNLSQQPSPLLVGVAEAQPVLGLEKDRVDRLASASESPEKAASRLQEQVSLRARVEGLGGGFGAKRQG